MGMPVSIHVRGDSPGLLREWAVEEALAALVEVDRVFSTYRADSEISRLRSGAIGVQSCSPAVAEVLELCAEANRLTGGYFSAWLPGPDGALALDPSGLVKGWAVERAARALTEGIDDDYYIGAGGDIALAVRGDTEHRPPWRVAVEDPLHPSRHLGVLELWAGGVATSGTAHRGSHIVDPITAEPATALASVTVVGPSLLWADVLATAACARGGDALSWLDWPAGYHALAVTAAGRVLRTDGMAELLAD
jgi:thiamine biosynthesis lipoprotein